jgi:heat shock protein HslJ
MPPKSFCGPAILAAIVVCTGMLAACSSSAKPASAAPKVVGHTYVSTAVTGHTMAAGTTVSLKFGTDGKLQAFAGCNTMSADFLVQNGQLVAGRLAMTEVGCVPASRQNQDAWLAGVLDGRPQIVQTGSALTLTAGTTTIDLAES